MVDENVYPKGWPNSEAKFGTTEAIQQLYSQSRESYGAKLLKHTEKTSFNCA